MNSKDVILTSKSSDHNCDVVVFGEKQNILIQCKHHKNTKKAEDEKPIYEIHISRDYYENALDVKFEKLLVYTTSKKFEKQAQECAEKFGVDLRYSKHLESDLKKLKISFEQVLYRDQNRMSV